jgi:cystathionine gamma-synthase
MTRATRRALTDQPTATLAAAFHLTGGAADAYHDWTGEGTFRLSIGLEDPADLIADLDQALAD